MLYATLHEHGDEFPASDIQRFSILVCGRRTVGGCGTIFILVISF